MAQEAISCFGRIDTWITNAGVSIYGRLDEVSESDSKRLFETNFWGIVKGSLAALPYLKAQGGALLMLAAKFPRLLCRCKVCMSFIADEKYEIPGSPPDK